MVMSAIGIMMRVTVPVVMAAATAVRRVLVMMVVMPRPEQKRRPAPGAERHGGGAEKTAFDPVFGHRGLS